jgi:CubicO group peptidase (beta-lactamase class C family)
VIWRNHIVGRWGDPERVDTAFSVTKTALATLTALALADGRIELEEPVGQRLDIAAFREPHNRPITWRHLLTLTSEWRGSLWGIPDSIDWNRSVPKRPDAPPKGTFRPIHPPGSHWEFNDVRVNLLALALTHVFEENLATVFARRVMDPIGASATWSWQGYRGADILLAEKTTPVVAGGAHWGGGLIISAIDLARLGLLYARRGNWEGRAVLPEHFFDLIRIPSPQHPNFGLMWWVNTGRLIPSLSASAIWGSGIANFLVIDPLRELVIVMRWFDVGRRDEIIRRIVTAIESGE